MRTFIRLLLFGFMSLFIITGCAPASTNITGTITIQQQSSQPAERQKDESVKQKALPLSGPHVPGVVSNKQDSESWKIEYQVSGGFAGVRRQMELSSDGKLIATDLKRGKSIERQASPEQLTQITSILAKIDFGGRKEARPRVLDRCADCFQHAVAVHINKQRHSLHFDDVSLRGSPYAALIGFLSSLLNQCLSNIGPDR
jgi:hypothetical protein